MEFRLSAVTDFFSEQPWFQQLKTKWEELDPQSRGNLQIACGVLSLLLVAFLFLWTLVHVYSLKKEYLEKAELLSTIQSANDEIQRLKSTGAPAPSADQVGGWTAYFETLAVTSGVEKSAITVSGEKTLGSGTATKETLFDLNLKHSTIRQIIKFSFSLETGNRPVRLKNIAIEAATDLSGYMDATLSISAFSLAEEKTGKK